MCIMFLHTKNATRNWKQKPGNVVLMDVGMGEGCFMGWVNISLSFERGNFLFPFMLRAYVSVCSSLSLLYYIVLLLSRACLELLVDEPPLLVEVDRHCLSKSMAT